MPKGNGLNTGYSTNGTAVCTTGEDPQGVDDAEERQERGGEDGTLARKMKGEALEGRVRAKTGTLNFVSTLAGYVTGPGGRPMAFAILSGDVARRDALPLEQRERPPGGRAWLVGGVVRDLPLPTAAQDELVRPLFARHVPTATDVAEVVPWIGVTE
mgnify:CR=1 FL=1